MYCPNCGKKIEDGGCSCKECGTTFVMMTTKKDHSETYRWLVLTFAVLAQVSTLLRVFTTSSAYEFFASSLSSSYYGRPYALNLWTLISKGGFDEESILILIPAVVFCGVAMSLFIMMLVGCKGKGTVAVVLSSVMLAVSVGIVGLLAYAISISYWSNYMLGAGAIGMVICSLGAFIFSMLLKKTGKRRF